MPTNRISKELPQQLLKKVKSHMQLSMVILSIFVTVGICYALKCNGLHSYVISAIERSHYNLFSVIASISGSLLGFSLASVSIVIAIFDKVSKPVANTKTEPITEGLLNPGEEEGCTPNPFIEAVKNRPSKLGILKNSIHYKEIYTAFMFSAKVLAITTITAILGMLPNINSILGNTIICLLSFLILLSIFNVLWCIKILDSIVILSLQKE